MGGLELKLLNALTHEPQKATDLMYVVGLNSSSDLRELVHRLRLLGYPVCSRTKCGGGYWLGNEDDKNRTLADLKSRRREINDVICALERGPIEGQIEVKL